MRYRGAAGLKTVDVDSKFRGHQAARFIAWHALDDALAGEAAVFTQATLSLGAEKCAVPTDQIENTFPFTLAVLV